mmetsp:Transcript_657/g.1793  ORF Transcript_657/g.1793 Transcript_657/m.1793 type:complete len:228 (+) Transcript_657:931-1614(+)
MPARAKAGAKRSRPRSARCLVRAGSGVVPDGAAGAGGGVGLALSCLRNLARAPTAKTRPPVRGSLRFFNSSWGMAFNRATEAQPAATKASAYLPKSAVSRNAFRSEAALPFWGGGGGGGGGFLAASLCAVAGSRVATAATIWRSDAASSFVMAFAPGARISNASAAESVAAVASTASALTMIIAGVACCALCVLVPSLAPCLCSAAALAIAAKLARRVAVDFAAVAR